MERTKGGYIILDLTMLPLAEVEETSISNAEVLKQLFSLSDYALRPDRQLKPIYLRAVSSSGVEVVSLCELDRNGLVLRIKALVLDVIAEVVVDFENKTVKYEVVSEANRILNEVESAQSGSIVNALGLDSDGGLVKEGLSDRIIDEVESAEEGTIDKVLGLDASGGLVKGAVSSGTKLYKHSLTISKSGVSLSIVLIADTPDEINALSENNDTRFGFIFDYSNKQIVTVLTAMQSGGGPSVTYYPLTCSTPYSNTVNIIAFTTGGTLTENIISNSLFYEGTITDTVTAL